MLPITISMADLDAETFLFEDNPKADNGNFRAVTYIGKKKTVTNSDSLHELILIKDIDSGTIYEVNGASLGQRILHWSDTNLMKRKMSNGLKAWFFVSKPMQKTYGPRYK